MATYTTRNDLIKPGYTDAADIDDLNDNFDFIDGSIAPCEWAKAIDPTANDDVTLGYIVGSMWLNTTGHKLFICEDNTDTAAVWRQLYPDTYTGDLKADGSVPLTADWDVGAYKITANQLVSDVADGGVAPFTSTSKVVCTNLNADMLDGLHDTSFVKQTLADAKGDVIVASGADTWARMAVGTDTQMLTSYAAGTNGVQWVTPYSGIYRQLLVNGSMTINQRVGPYVATFTYYPNNDDCYTLDCWNLLSDGNDIVDVGREATIVPANPSSGSSMKLEVETQNKKFGVVNFVENRDTLKYAPGTCSLQFKAYTVTGKVIENIRAAVVAWSSTANTITSDIVSAWENEGTNPTLAANWTYENVAVNLPLVADTWTTFKIENITLDTASTTNLGVFIWCDDTDAAVDDLLYIADVQLNYGPVCLPYEIRSFEEEYLKCLRYFEKSYVYAYYAGYNTGDTGIYFVNFGHATSAQRAYTFPFEARKLLAAPVITVYDRAGNQSKISLLNAAGDTWTDNSAYSGVTASDKSFFLYVNATTAGGFGLSWTAAAVL